MPVAVPPLEGVSLRKGIRMSEAVYGWTGKILRVDLSNSTMEIQDSLRFAEDYLGGRGFAARIAWEELKPGIGAFDPENLLMFMPGGLAGTPAPTSGRTSVCGISPQAYPQEWFTRSNMGGHWGTELKYAGYDGVVVKGASETPVYLWIEDGQVEIRDASHLWGRGIFDTQRMLMEELGSDVRVLTMGQAGERLSRIAIVATETESAAGQGGFGGVMGSKGLKAIAVRGHGAVPVADPAALIARCKLIREGMRSRFGGRRRGRGRSDRPDPYGTKLYACTQHCPRPCVIIRTHVPGVVHKDRIYSGVLHCCAPGLSGRRRHGWEIGFEAGFEVAQTCNDYGLNHWEFLFAFGPWITECQKRGELIELDGDRVDLNDPHFWMKMVHKVAFREGWGDAFAEGGMRAAKLLGIGEDVMARFYPGYGQASHWDGHGSFPSPPFPYWLVTGLQWAMDTRDPLGGGHGYTSNMVRLGREIEPDDRETWEKVRRLGEHVYGHPSAADPWAGYEGKAHAASLHCDRNPLKDSLGICDNMFPRIVDRNAEDLLARVDGLEGRHFDWYMAGPAFGWDLSKEAFYRIGTRVFTMERAIHMRNWDRTRRTDETVIPYLSQPEPHPSPYTGEPMVLDREAFGRLMEEFYDLRGWDRESGWPYRKTWEQLGMKEVADELDRLDRLPEGASSRVRRVA